MRTVGLHLRVHDTLTATAQQARALGLRSFQCFISLDACGNAFEPTDDDVAQFCAIKQQFDTIFLHASYFVNPADCARTSHPILEREVALAQRLGMPYLILHPGVAGKPELLPEGLDALARVINYVHGTQDQVTLVLENTAHGARAVGSNFEHLELLFDKLDDPDRIRFCIDTAHAYAYGYDVSDTACHNALIGLIDTTISIERVVLIHLNDTQQALSSYIDRHCELGKGCIGNKALNAFVCHERLAHIPLILELPVSAQPMYKQVVDMVMNWSSL